MKTKATCPKCGTDITTWRGQIAVCTATFDILTPEEMASGITGTGPRCNYQGMYPNWAEVEEKDL